MGDQKVFASSKAPSSGKKATRRESRSTPSEGTAASDAWSGFGSGTAPAGAPAVASLGEEGSGSALGLAILGLGLVGMLGVGAFALVAPRRQRAKASRR